MKMKEIVQIILQKVINQNKIIYKKEQEVEVDIIQEVKEVETNKKLQKPNKMNKKEMIIKEQFIKKSKTNLKTDYKKVDSAKLDNK